MPMNHALKESFVAHVRSGRYRVCQYHLAKEGIGSMKEYTPLGILVELAEIPYEWRPCLLHGGEPGHLAMYVFGDYETLEDSVLEDMGLARESHEQAGFCTLPDEVIDEVGISREQVETLRSMANGGYGANKQRIFPATMNQLAEWIFRNVETDEPEDPHNETGPAPDFRQLPISATAGDPNAVHENFSALPGPAKKGRKNKDSETTLEASTS